MPATRASTLVVSPRTIALAPTRTCVNALASPMRTPCEPSLAFESEPRPPELAFAVELPATLVSALALSRLMAVKLLPLPIVTVLA